MSISCRCGLAALCSMWLVVGATGAARGAVYELAAAGVISANTSGDATIPVGTPWAFLLWYDTAAPDLDFEVLGADEPTYGRFKNTASPPALRYFRYRAGGYEAILDEPADFGEQSEMLITFTSIHAIDINIRAPGLFPQLGGAEVSFHADFNAFQSAPVLANDGLPTDVSLGLASFDDNTVSILPPSGFISGTQITRFAIREVPEPGAIWLMMAGSPLGIYRRRRRLPQ